MTRRLPLLSLLALGAVARAGEVELVPLSGDRPDGGLTSEVVRLERRFDAGKLQKLASLRLAVRYQDGFVAWLNGVEVARRRLGGEAAASEPHGTEIEHFTLPPSLLRTGENVLALEVRSFKAGRRALAEVGLTASDTLRFVRGPYLQRVYDRSGWLLLDTDLPSRASVRYGPVGGGEERELKVRGDQSAFHHALELRELEPGTSYRYRVEATSPDAAPVSVEAEFRTPPAAGRSFRFAVYGDLRDGHDVHQQIVGSLGAERPDLALVTGDLVDRGTDEGSWERFFEISTPLMRQVAIYPVLGNHDLGLHRLGVERFAAFFGRGRPEDPWSSFDVAGVHFIGLDSASFENPAQLGWLTADLQAARRTKYRAIVVFAHQGPWSSGLHGDHRVAIRDYVPVFERYGVTMLFAGHDHDYERGQVGRLPYLVSGGGGAPLRPPRCSVAPEPTLPRCASRVRAFVNEHHYVMVELTGDRMRVCPKRPDGTPLEACSTIGLRR